MKHGFGVYTWPEGQVYKGNWVDGMQHGLGTYSYCDQGQTIVKYGLWKNGTRQQFFTVSIKKDLD
jgi:hypothetical protein